MVVDAQPLGDDGHPRVEATLACEAGHRPQGLEERFLGEFLGRVGVAYTALAVLVQAGVVAAVQLVEGGFVASLIPENEGAVTIEVDRPRIVNFFRP
jgi:hypothetical protein